MAELSPEMAFRGSVPDEISSCCSPGRGSVGAHLTPPLLWCFPTSALLIQACNGELLPFQWVEFCSSPPLSLSKILWVAQAFWIPCQWFCSLCQASWVEKIPAGGCWLTPCSTCLVTETWSFVLCLVYWDAFFLSTLLLTWSLLSWWGRIRRELSSTWAECSCFFLWVSNGLTDCCHVATNVHPSGGMAGLMGFSRYPSPEELHVGQQYNFPWNGACQAIWQRFYISVFFSFPIFSTYCAERLSYLVGIWKINIFFLIWAVSAPEHNNPCLLQKTVFLGEKVEIWYSLIIWVFKLPVNVTWSIIIWQTWNHIAYIQRIRSHWEEGQNCLVRAVQWSLPLFFHISPLFQVFLWNILQYIARNQVVAFLFSFLVGHRSKSLWRSILNYLLTCLTMVQ